MSTGQSGLTRRVASFIEIMNIQPVGQIQGNGAVSGDPEIIPEKIRYFIYGRRSSEAEDRQIASIESQITELKKIAKEQGLEVVEIFSESKSAKSPGRTVFNEMLSKIHKGIASGILCWKLDRLARNPVDGGTISWMLQEGKIKHIQTYGKDYYPKDNVLMMSVEFGMANQFVKDLSENVKRGLRTKCLSGARPGVSPLGYIHDKSAIKGQKKILIDNDRAPVIKELFQRVAYQDQSGRDLQKWLNEIGFTTRTGKPIALSAIYRILKDTFYYGEFRYPVNGGVLYKGSYPPIIDKDLYLKAQANLLAPPRRHPGTNDFAFIQLMFCGNCGSSICAEEKFKHQKNGNTHRYVYYHCTRGKDRDCKEKAIREEELVRQLLHIIDKVDIDEFSAQEKIKKEVMRYRKFSYSVLGKETEFDRRPIETDMRNYIKYVLSEGSKDEKREILSCLKSKLILQNKNIQLRIGGTD